MPPEEGNDDMSKNFLMMEAGTVNRGEAKTMARSGGVVGYAPENGVNPTAVVGEVQDKYNGR